MKKKLLAAGAGMMALGVLMTSGAPAVYANSNEKVAVENTVSARAAFENREITVRCMTKAGKGVTAQAIITDMQGNVIETVELVNGTGKTMLPSSTLYNVDVVVDGYKVTDKKNTGGLNFATMNLTSEHNFYVVAE